MAAWFFHMEVPMSTKTAKKSVETVREELRVLNAAADDGAVDNNDSWITPEFWAMAVGAVTNLVAVGVLVGWVDASQAETLTKSLTAVIGATQIVVLNSALIWKYIAGRTAVRAQMIDARYRYMEAVAVEKMRADRPY
jgi:hypothetical protein